MEHIPITESDVEKVYRIARELRIGLEEAAITCDAFHLAFSDEGLRRSIFGMIEELDESAVRKGEPLGLIITYTVELGIEGIRVGRYADEIPPGEIVELTPPNRARILLKIKENFPTQEFLGPIIMNKLPSLDKEGWQTDAFCRADGVVRSDTEITEPDIPTELPSHWPDVAICLGPIRYTFNKRFPLSPGPRRSLSISPSYDRQIVRLTIRPITSRRGRNCRHGCPRCNRRRASPRRIFRRIWDTPNERCSFGNGNRRRDMCLTF